MNVTLTKIHHARFASEETECFDAVVCLDGVACIFAKNNGTGGDTDLSDLPGHAGSVSKLEAYAATLPPHKCPWANEDGSPHMMPLDGDLLINELLMDFITLRDLKRMLKRTTLFVEHKGAKLSELKKCPFTAEKEPAIRKYLSKYPEVIILNTLPEIEALKLFKESAA